MKINPAKPLFRVVTIVKNSGAKPKFPQDFWRMVNACIQAFDNKPKIPTAILMPKIFWPVNFKTVEREFIIGADHSNLLPRISSNTIVFFSIKGDYIFEETNYFASWRCVLSKNFFMYMNNAVGNESRIFSQGAFSLNIGDFNFYFTSDSKRSLRQVPQMPLGNSILLCSLKNLPIRQNDNGFMNIVTNIGTGVFVSSSEYRFEQQRIGSTNINENVFSIDFY